MKCLVLLVVLIDLCQNVLPQRNVPSLIQMSSNRIDMSLCRHNTTTGHRMIVNNVQRYRQHVPTNHLSAFSHINYIGTGLNVQLTINGYKTLNQKIQQESPYSEFNTRILNNSREARLKLHYEQLTVFVPENAAFRHSQAKYRNDLIFYHMSYEYKTLDMLKETHSLSSVILENPPLWITKRDRDIFVNNAKIIPHKSNYITRSRTGDFGKQQVLHVIDSVLDPIIPSSQSSPSAYDFLHSISNWNLGAAKTISNFLTRVQETKFQYIFKQQNAGHTYFIPLDSGIGPYKFKMINKNILFGHVIPFYVLFTKPTPKNYAYESLANDEDVYIMLTFEEKYGKMYIKGLMKGSSGEGEFTSEIIVPNIPVNNGVVHLISQPLGIYTRHLKPFPYVSVLEKLSSNPENDVFYNMGQKTGFNKIFTKENISFTYFVPNDSAWTLTQNDDLEPVEKDLDILSRHLIISESPYSVEQLVSLTKANNFTEIELQTKGGPLRIMVLIIKGDYYLRWNNKYIKIIRPDYECTNGVIHILASPMTNFRRKDMNLLEVGGKVFKGYWKKLTQYYDNDGIMTQQDGD